MRASLIALLAVAAACAGAGSTPSRPVGTVRPPVVRGEDRDGDVLSTLLDVDLAARRGHAVVDLVPAADGTAGLDVRGLVVDRVEASPEQVAYGLEDGVLVLRSARGAAPLSVAIDYAFSLRSSLDGATPNGLTMTWPDHCGNIFPCDPDPIDGTRFGLRLTGLPPGAVAVYPREIAADVPAFMLAWAVGPFTYRELGRTSAGTRVGVYYHQGEEAAAAAGTAHLLAAFDWLEATYGPYRFGDDVASVSAAWGESAYGGMEHHPYWHVASRDLDVEEIHIHEAAHGWMGNGVRIECWEDLVLSEGTTSYLTARAIAAVAGEDRAAETWAAYERRLARAQARERQRIAWPRTCGAVDVERDLFTGIVYMKGAFFFRALEGRVGAAALDRALAAFYRAHQGRAASMADLLATVRDETGYDPSACVEAWLRSEPIPPLGPCPAP